MTAHVVIEWCRECRDEAAWLAPGREADFILWGKLFPPEALGPRCYDHAEKWIGRADMLQIEMCAVYDLRPVHKAARGMSAADLGTATVTDPDGRQRP